MRKVLLSAVAGAAVIMSGPLAAQSGKGQDRREQARQNSQGPANANRRGVERSNENSVLHQGHSQRDSDRQRDSQQRKREREMRDTERSRERDMRNRDRMQERETRQEDRARAREGMEVRDRNGRRVGQVREVRRAPDGSVIAIIVVLVVQVNNTNVITLPANSFTIINNVVVINSLNLNIGS